MANTIDLRTCSAELYLLVLHIAFPAVDADFELDFTEASQIRG
jgi:hypothetical protein